MRKTIAYMLMIGLILSSSYIEVFSVNSEINSEQEFFDYLDKIGTRKSNDGSKIASYSTYKEYDLIVYGSPWGETKPYGINGKTGPQQRHLGYTIDDEKYTNPYFPPDDTSGRTPEEFNYVKPAEASESWRDIDPDQKDHMLNSPLSGNGATSPSFTLNSIGGIDYGKLLSESTWKSQGSIYLQHKGASGKIWYITQTTPPMVGDTIVTGQISTPSDTYYIRRNDTQVVIPTTVTARAVLSGRAKDRHIDEIKATSMGSGQTASRKATVSKTTNFIATRANYSPGTHTVTLNGSVSLKSIFNDTGSSNVSKTITLIVEEEGDEPYVTTTVTPSPREKKFEDKDVDVTLTVKGDLHNYTKTSNIKEWVFYARHKEDPKNFLTKKVYRKALSASTDFEFKIPASKVVGDNFIQHYVVRSAVYFNEKVDGEDFYDAPAETFVRVYKEDEPVEPPPTDNIPPVALIGGPEEIYVGNTAFFYDRSTDEDGYIAERYWGHSTDEVVEGKLEDNTTGGTLRFTEVGAYMINLLVYDNEGAGAYASHILNVLPPPPPVASLNFSGSLKENRLLKMTNTSTSDNSFPIIESKTEIEITPIDHGATNNIKYEGNLTDNLEKIIVFKNSGTYKFKITVTNTAGLSDTREYIRYIQPDAPPIADFSTAQTLYRDKYDNNYAKMEVTDLSFSPDGDPITERIWKLKYNSTNNKNPDGTNNFSDDPILNIRDSYLTIGTEKTYSHNGVIYKVTKIATDKINIKVNQIGYYLLDLEVIEGIGQDYIPEYIDPSDFQRGDTSNKHHFEKTIKVDNREPFVDFN